MPSDQIIFAGVELSPGTRPVTFAALDGELQVQSLKKWDIFPIAFQRHWLNADTRYM